MPKGIPKNGINSGWIKKGTVPSNKGIRGVVKLGPRSEETRKKISERKKGIIFSEEHREKIRQALKGKRVPHREGKNCNWWKGGFTKTVNLLRNCFKYRQWRSDIFTRDDFTCQHCGVRGGRLNVHHLTGFTLLVRENNISSYEDGINCELLWNINNGLTLCEECHIKTDNFAGKKKSNNKK